MRRRRPDDLWRAWSYSKLDALLTCPLMFQFRYMERRHVPNPVLPAVGQALHYIANVFYRQHPSTKRYPYDTPEKLCATWTRFWLNVADGKHGTKGFSAKKNPPLQIAWHNFESDRGYWIGRGKQILTKFFEINHPRRGTGAGIMRERMLSFTWMGFIIRAIIDRIDDVDRAITIADYKMGNQTDYDLADDFQFTIYQLGYGQCLQKHFAGKPLSRLVIETLSPHGRCSEAPLRTPEQFAALHRTIAIASQYVQGVVIGRVHMREALERSRIFHAADVDDRIFSPRLPRGDHCRYCNYVAPCQQWERAHREKLRTPDLPYATSADVWQSMIRAAQRDAMPTQLRLPFDDTE